jgi:acetyl-CoA acetyltransferase
MKTDRLTHQQLAMVLVGQREWAAKNPRATFRQPITVESVLNGPERCRGRWTRAGHGAELMDRAGMVAVPTIRRAAYLIRPDGHTDFAPASVPAPFGQ